MHFFTYPIHRTHCLLCLYLFLLEVLKVVLPAGLGEWKGKIFSKPFTVKTTKKIKISVLEATDSLATLTGKP